MTSLASPTIGGTTPPFSFDIGPVIGIVLGVSGVVILGICIMIIGILLWYYCYHYRRRIKSNGNPSVDPHIVTVSNESYSTVVLPSLPTTTNPAYEHITSFNGPNYENIIVR